MRTPALLATACLGLAVALVACSDRANPLEVTTHPEGWTVPNAATFHGDAVLESISSAQNCQTCHGADYLGGTSGVSCQTSGCHPGFPHPEGFADASSPDFHSVAISSDAIAWDISVCQNCHGTDYAGEGFARKNCLTCHTQPDGPEACHTCHGNTENAAPPEGLRGETSTSEIAVGAHQVHLGPSDLAESLACVHCHAVPSTLAAAGHLDGTPVRAEVAFSSLATQNGRLTPVWDASLGTCGNVYCHGGFVFRKDESNNPFAYVDSVITGENPTLDWTSVGTGQAVCGTCHGLPPAGHLRSVEGASLGCHECHPRVVDQAFNINAALHINGEVEVF